MAAEGESREDSEGNGSLAVDAVLAGENLLYEERIKLLHVASDASEHRSSYHIVDLFRSRANNRTDDGAELSTDHEVPAADDVAETANVKSNIHLLD